MKAKKIFYSILSVILVAISVFTICFLCVDNFNIWVKSKFNTHATAGDPADSDNKNPDDQNKDNSGGSIIEDNEQGEVFAISDNGTVMREGGVYEMPSSITVVSRSVTSRKTRDMDGAAGGAIGGAITGGTVGGVTGENTGSNASSVGSGEITLVASLTNSYIKNADFEFTYNFENSSSAWARGKAVGDFIGVQQAYDSEIKGGQIRLRVKEAFGEPIIVTATLDGGTSYATCKLNYLQRAAYKVDTISLGGTDATDETNIECTVSYGIGTVKGEATLKSALLTLDSSFIDKVKDYLTFNVTFKGYSFDTATAKVKTSDNYIEVSDGVLNYSMFIKDFDKLSQSQKNAVYYAWDKAYKSFGSRKNVYIDISINYSYKGNVIFNIEEFDILGGAFTGDLYASETNYDVVIDGNTIF